MSDPRPAPAAAGHAPGAPPAPAPVLPPLPRPQGIAHHWLTVVVARPGPAAPVPVAGARVTVRAFPRGAPRPGDPVARGTTGADGSVALQLPAGRYAVSAQHGGEARVVTVTLEHGGRALLLLEAPGRRVTLTVEAFTPDGRPLPHAVVDVRTSPAGTPAARGHADERGVLSLPLPPGAYEVRVGDASARTYLEADTRLRLTAEPAPADARQPPPVTPYAQRARAAATHVAPLDPSSVRHETWN